MRNKIQAEDVLELLRCGMSVKDTATYLGATTREIRYILKADSEDGPGLAPRQWERRPADEEQYTSGPVRVIVKDGKKV